MSKLRLVHGVGIYEKGRYSASENDKPTKVYNAWQAMLGRCYDSKYHEKKPTYIGCSVCEEWHHFQNFATWYDANYPNGDGSYQLDKDLKVSGSKIYSPETCLFVSSVVNTFTTDSGSIRGEYMIGVCWHKRGQKYLACCSNPFTKKVEYLGLFTNELEAHHAWRKRKSELAYELAMAQENDEVKNAILNWKKNLDENKIHVI
ncbi:hypothetical protein VmeM32_00219 [Vibrio phage vB_VmeM-32]|nr:hypothetical protein VmeM32_00219 [Vibrio phage vB_VmeM-32]